MFFFSTGKPELDQALGGGIAAGWISCIRGQSGSGKTMMLDSILSLNPAPVLHFLTETEEPKYVSVAKENYSFVVTKSAEEIKDRIAQFWMDGHGGIIAIDTIDQLDFGGCQKCPGDQARRARDWLHWFVRPSEQDPEETRLGHHVSSLVFTKMMRIQTLMGKDIISGSGHGMMHLTNQ